MGNETAGSGDPMTPGAASGEDDQSGHRPSADGCARESGDGSPPLEVPHDFTPVAGLIPDWIDIPGVCKEAKRFVALHTLSSFNALAINDGRRVFTADDRGGEFRRLFDRALTAANAAAASRPNGRRVLSDADAALVYDCEKEIQFVAPRSAAIQFLSRQF